DGHQPLLHQVQTDSKGYFLMRWSPSQKKLTKKELAGATDNTSDATEELYTGSKQQDTDGHRINTNMRNRTFMLSRAASAIDHPVWLGASHQGSTSIDARTLYPAPDNLVYRDIELQSEISDGCQMKTRLLGNSGTRELHDLQ